MKAIYIRTSTDEQEPENQIKEIEIISGKEYQLFQDKQSAWRDNKEREDFEKVKKLIQKKEINELYVWDWDRLFRNRLKLKEFFQFCSVYKCKIHSFRQQFYEKLYDVPSPFNDIMQGIVLDLLGWMAEDESKKKSERVQLAVRKGDGKPTMSYKGNKWGRKEISTQKKNKILELYKVSPELTIRQISEQTGVSIGVVHKLITKFKKGKEHNLDVQDLSH